MVLVNNKICSGKRWLSPIKIGFSMIFVVLVWGMYLLSATQFKYNNIKESEYLKTEIIKLSKKYILALSEEKHTSEIGVWISFIIIIFLYFICIIANCNVPHWIPTTCNVFTQHTTNCCNHLPSPTLLIVYVDSTSGAPHSQHIPSLTIPPAVGNYLCVSQVNLL